MSQLEDNEGRQKDVSALTNDRLDLRRVKKTPEQIQRLHAKMREIRAALDPQETP